MASVASVPKFHVMTPLLNTPPLLADVAHVLRDNQLRVHDARVATFGERAEDVFQITTLVDGADCPLDEAQQSELRDTLLACLDGDCP